MHINQTAIELDYVRAVSRALTTKESVRRLMPYHGWLWANRSVRMFFELFFQENRREIQAAAKGNLLKPTDAAKARREIVRLLSDEQNETEQIVNGKPISIWRLYRGSLKDIKDHCLARNLKPKKAIEAFNETIAVLHRGIRLARKL